MLLYISIIFLFYYRMKAKRADLPWLRRYLLRHAAFDAEKQILTTCEGFLYMILYITAGILCVSGVEKRGVLSDASGRSPAKLSIHGDLSNPDSSMLTGLHGRLLTWRKAKRQNQVDLSESNKL